MILVSISLSLVLFGLAIIHFNWAFGGKFGFSEALPTNKIGQKVLNPKKIHSLIVAILFSSFALFYIFKSDLINGSLPGRIAAYSGWIIPVIFLLRAIGDFKYVGFFKSIKQSKFAKCDTIYFSPLCLLIAVLGIVIKLMD